MPFTTVTIKDLKPIDPAHLEKGYYPYGESDPITLDWNTRPSAQVEAKNCSCIVAVYKADANAPEQQWDIWPRYAGDSHWENPGPPFLDDGSTLVIRAYLGRNKDGQRTPVTVTIATDPQYQAVEVKP